MKNLIENLAKQSLKSRPQKTIPETPGVYFFLKGSIPIYIGKAINLKRRVSSYFDLKIIGKTARMVKEATHLSYIKVDSELEAILLEAKLIRAYMPDYNFAAKDDKHPLYIQITKEQYPRVITARKIEGSKKNIAFFGPFPSSANVRSVLSMIRKIFPFSDHKLSTRACLYAHIGLCNPCPNEIERIKDPNLKNLYKKEYLKNIVRVKGILSEKFERVKKDLHKEMSILSKSQDYEQAKIVRDQIKRLEYITSPHMPVDYYIENPNLYEDQRRAEIKDLKSLLKKNDLKLQKLIRIECFDIAHLSGVKATASMVTFIEGVAEKTFYRHFRIKKARGGDDYGSLKEVIERRIKHLNGWGRPDLIIVDGGVGQVNIFSEVLKNNKIDIPVIGIAKNPDRLIIKNDKIRLEGASLNLLARIRDEAHRFARRYHHGLISISLSQ